MYFKDKLFRCIDFDDTADAIQFTKKNKIQKYFINI